MQIHLFDIDIPGKVIFRESDTLTPGRTITVVDTEHGKLGIGICYDLRFQELAMLYAKRGVQLIIYPGELAHVIADGECTNTSMISLSLISSQVQSRFRTCLAHTSQCGPIPSRLLGGQRHKLAGDAELQRDVAKGA